MDWCSSHSYTVIVLDHHGEQAAESECQALNSVVNLQTSDRLKEQPTKCLLQVSGTPRRDGGPRIL